jgi:predicted esterase
VEYTVDLDKTVDSIKPTMPTSALVNWLLLALSLPLRGSVTMNNNVKMLQLPSPKRRKLLILHGNRQVGQLLVGRMERLRKKLQNGFNIEMLAPDGPFPHPDDLNMRQWWIRNGYEYQGLDQTLELIQSTWNENPDLDGILGFSQGARLAHLLVQCHESPNHPLHLEGLRYAIMFAGYDAPVPTNLPGVSSNILLETPSLHVYGLKDQLITPNQSKDVMKNYAKPIGHEHDSGHHVPMQAPHVSAYLKFLEHTLADIASAEVIATAPKISARAPEPDEDNMTAQQDEVEALSAIFPDEFKLLSGRKGNIYTTPITYRIDLPVSGEGVWPPHAVALENKLPS